MISKWIKIEEFISEKKIYNILNISLVGCFIALFMIRGESPVELIKYLLSQCIVIYGQGYLVCNILKLDLRRGTEFALSYGMGVAVIVFEYFIFMGLINNISLINIGYLFGIYGLFKRFRKLKDKKFDYANNGVFTVAIGLCILCFFSLYVKNSMPDVIGRIGINQDVLWSIGNTQSLLREFPPIDTRMTGIPFVYHYFVNIYYAVCTTITGIDPVKSYFVYGYIIKMFFLVCATFAFGSTYLKGKYKGYMFTAVYFFTSCASLKKAYGNGFGIFMNSNFKHLTDGAFGFELSMAMMMILFVVIKDFLENDENTAGKSLGAVLLFIVLSGTKGPIGLIVILALISVFVFEKIFLKRFNKRVLILFSIFSIVFVVLFQFVLKSGSGDLNFELAYIAKDTLIGRRIFDVLGNGLAGRIALIPIHFILYQPFASSMFIIWFMIKVTNIKECSTEDLIFGAISLIGIICAYIMSHYGHSEIYFLMTAIPFMEIVAIQVISDNELIKGIKVLGICLLIIGLTTGAFIVKGRFDLGLKYYSIAKSRVEFSKEPHPNAITDDEYEGICWIRDNTEEDAIVLSDRYYISEKRIDRTARYFYYSALSQRQFYLEGFFYFYAPDEYRSVLQNKRLVAKEIYEDSDWKLAWENDIDYIIVSRSLYDWDKSLKDEHFEEVFKNEEIIVYEVKWE